MPAPQITTPKPPLNLFEVKRAQVTDAWTAIYEVPEYRIPADGPTPLQMVGAVAIMTGLMIAHSGEEARTISARITDVDGNSYLVVHEVPVFPNDVLFLELDRQILTVGDRLELKMASGQTADASFSFILNTRETYEDLS